MVKFKLKQMHGTIQNTLPVLILSVLSSLELIGSFVVDCVHGQWPGGIESPERSKKEK